jgi:hypothetical protein
MTDPALSGAPGRAPDPTPSSHKVPSGILGLSDEPAPDGATPMPSLAQTWMHRISVFLFVLISAVAGVLLIILPWTPEWTDNYLLLSFPNLRTIVSNGFFRGICSGLGLLDIWIGFWEALHYHEHH